MITHVWFACWDHDLPLQLPLLTTQCTNALLLGGVSGSGERVRGGGAGLLLRGEAGLELETGLEACIETHTAHSLKFKHV